MFRSATETRSTELAPGECVQLSNELLLICVLRSAWLPGELDLAHDDFAFGRADADGIVGESPAIWSLRHRITFVAKRPDHVLIRGASGTGKELVAKAIHRHSVRRQRPLVSRNAATFPETLIDAELFGNAKNFPNPGMADRPGLVGQADGSILFLDEFAELPLPMQAHLLRVLDAGEYQRLGETSTRRADFRLVGATNRPYSSLKEDLLARFQFRVQMPTLNERREDIPLLVAHLLDQLEAEDPELAAALWPDAGSRKGARISVELMRRLIEHNYATHTRELRMLLWQALANGGELDEGTEVPASTDNEGRDAVHGATDPPPGPPPLPSMRTPRSSRELPPDEIQACLDRHQGIIEKAWPELGLSSRFALARLIQKHGLIRRR